MVCAVTAVIHPSAVIRRVVAENRMVGVGFLSCNRSFRLRE